MDTHWDTYMVHWHQLLYRAVSVPAYGIVLQEEETTIPKALARPSTAVDIPQQRDLIGWPRVLDTNRAWKRNAAADATNWQTKRRCSRNAPLAPSVRRRSMRNAPASHSVSFGLRFRWLRTKIYTKQIAPCCYLPLTFHVKSLTFSVSFILVFPVPFYLCFLLVCCFFLFRCFFLLLFIFLLSCCPFIDIGFQFNSLLPFELWTNCWSTVGYCLLLAT